MQDTQVADLIAAEIKRQQLGIEMIPSENYVSPDVLKALGSVFTINIPRAIQAGATTADKKTPTKLSNWRLTALKNYSKPTMPLSSRTLVPRPTRRCIMRGVSQAITFWRWI